MANVSSSKPITNNYSYDNNFGHGLTRPQVSPQGNASNPPNYIPDGTSLTVLANGVLQAQSINIPAWSVYGNGLVSGTNSAFTKVPYNIVEFDHARKFDTVLNRYYVPVQGIYQVNAAIGVTASASGYIQIALYKNGVIFKSGPTLTNTNVALTATFPTVTASWTVEIGVGEYIEIWAFQNSGGALNLGSNSSIFGFSGYLIKQTA
jgi:hypothetical protein